MLISNQFNVHLNNLIIVIDYKRKENDVIKTLTRTNAYESF